MKGEVDEVEWAQYHSEIIGDFLKKHLHEVITEDMIENVTHEKELAEYAERNKEKNKNPKE